MQMQKAIIGKKVGMTQIFDESGKVIPVTVIEAGPVSYTHLDVYKRQAGKDQAPAARAAGGRDRRQLHPAGV